MKIGILTLPLETNYGGILQAFAMQKVLRNMGHDVLTIDRHNPKVYRSAFHNLLSFGKRLKQHYLEGKDVSVCWNGYMSDDVFRQLSANTQPFISRNIRQTRHVLSPQLAEIDDEYQFDAYVVGSDQVWLPNYCPASFLPFVKRLGVKKVVYAASCGRQSWMDNPQLIPLCQSLSENFNGLSAREASLAERASAVLGREVVHVLDPTMLLTPQDYLESIDVEPTNERTLFSYILDASNFKSSVQQLVAAKKGLNIEQGNVSQYYVKKRDVNIEACVFPSVDHWLNGYNNAGFVVTDSFHGTVFSILFNKPFLVIGNKQRGMGRFESLLRLFGLQNRMVFNLDDAQARLEEPIDFSKANQEIERGRGKAMDFLKQSLA